MTTLNIGDSRVIESREVGDGVTIRRRRETPDGKRFTTYERIEKPNLAVSKKTVQGNFTIVTSSQLPLRGLPESF